METNNVLLTLATKQLPPSTMRFLLMPILFEDDKLFEFFKIQVEYALFEREGNTEPTPEETATEMSALMTAVSLCPLGAALLYQEFLEKGKAHLEKRLMEVTALRDGVEL